MRIGEWAYKLERQQTPIETTGANARSHQVHIHYIVSFGCDISGDKDTGIHRVKKVQRKKHEDDDRQHGFQILEHWGSALLHNSAQYHMCGYCFVCFPDAPKEHCHRQTIVLLRAGNHNRSHFRVLLRHHLHSLQRHVHSVPELQCIACNRKHPRHNRKHLYQPIRFLLRFAYELHSHIWDILSEYVLDIPVRHCEMHRTEKDWRQTPEWIGT